MPKTTGSGRDDMIPREHMHNASCMAGIAFNSAGLGLCHAMAHALGARFHIPHGRANALLLPEVIRFNGKRAPARYQVLAENLGLTGGNSQDAVFLLSRKVQQLRKKIGIPQNAEEAGIEKDEFLRAIPDMAEAAMADSCLKTNPCPVGVSEIAELFRRLI